MPNAKKNDSTTLTRQIKYLLLVLALSFCHFISFGQQNKIDSLLFLLKKDSPDTNKVTHLNALGWEYKYRNPDTSYILLSQSLALAKKIKWEKGIANALGNIGGYNLNQGNYPKALDYYLKALKIDEALHNKEGIAKRLGNIGIVYDEQADYPKALDYYFMALKISEELGNKNLIATWLVNIGVVYKEQADYPKALDYYFKALKMNEELGKKNSIATILGNIGSVYYSLAYEPQVHSVERDSLLNRTLDYYFKALTMAEELGDKHGIAINLGGIGSLYTDQKKYPEAEKYLMDALKMDKEIGAQDYEKQVEEYLSNLYEKTNRYQFALEHYKKAMVLKDTIFSQENKKQLVRKEMNFEFDKKEAHAKAEQDKINAITAEEKQRQKVVTYSVSVGLFLVLLFAVFIFRGYRQKQKANIIITHQKSEVEKQKHIIEEKNKDITASINYAKRIQQAKLPKKEEIYSALPNCFVLFKPKDIVSGDFYFFHNNNQSVFIASADCTGHGVPGAFMSMIGSEKLEDAVSQSTDTSEILKLLNQGIKISLRQSDSNESTRDGMDIALCSVDTVNRIVKYAGANRPLWIIRNGQTTVEEIKATKKAIGGFTEDSQHFDTHEIKFQQGDTFYISTDGYADTFGGQEEKKLTTKRFKEILLSIQDKSLKEQGHHLDNFIKDWKGGTEQVDDILVIGVRL